MRCQPLALLDHQTRAQPKIAFRTHKFFVSPNVAQEQNRGARDNREEGSMFLWKSHQNINLLRAFSFRSPFRTMVFLAKAQSKSKGAKLMWKPVCLVAVRSVKFQRFDLSLSSFPTNLKVEL